MGDSHDEDGGLVQMPEHVELQTPEGPKISKFGKRKKKAKAAKIKVFQDAANSCDIEVDDYGNLLSVMLSDDLAHTYLKFGKEEYDEARLSLQEGQLLPITAKKKAFLRTAPRTMYYTGAHQKYEPVETLAGMGQNKHYKKVKVRKTKLKGKKAKVELLFAADKADLIVEEYSDKVGKIYVAFPDRSKHKTYLFALPERLNVVAEEYSKDIPIRRAIDDKANWFVQDTESEYESEDEYEHRPIMAEAAAEALDDALLSDAIRKGSYRLRGSIPQSGSPMRLSRMYD